MKKTFLAGMCLLGLASLTQVGCDATSAVAGSSDGPYYQEIDHDGRTFVVGSPEMAAKFEEHKHLPYTKTVIGGGNMGQTVVVEVDKSDAEYADRLWSMYKEKNLYYAEEEAHGRIYVIGSPEMHEKFKANKHLPYTYTRIGEGPAGQTVVVEVDKKNPAHAQRLWSEFVKENLYYAEEEAHGRVYVIGNPDTHKKFKSSGGHLPYTRTLIGAGPGGKTLVFEVDKKDPSVADRLIRQYEAKKG